MMKTYRFALATLSALAVSACAVGPDYVAPPPRSASSGPFLSANRAAFTPTPLPADWWRLYNDPVLDALVEDALVANTDVRQALAHIERARAALRGARADRLPQTSIGASETYNRLPETQVPAGARREDWSYDAGIDVAVLDSGAGAIWPGAIPFRVMVDDKDAWRARAALAEAGIEEES